MAEEKNIQQVSDFTDIVDNINDLDFSDNQKYIICDYNNPQNHIEVSQPLEEDTKKEMKEKGGFSDNAVIFSDEENYKKFVETGKLDFPSEDETEQEIVQEQPQDIVQKEVQEEVPKEVSKPKATKKAVSSQEQKEFFENFMQDNTQKQSVAMARQIDKINALENKIERLKSVKEKLKK